MILITNNPLVRDHFSGAADVELRFIDCLGYMDVLRAARDEIHQGKVLLTHPLSGSVKPNETPYKSVAVDSQSLHDIDSLWLIEQAIATYEKFQKNKALPQWVPRVREDFMVVDFDLIKNALKR
ncbi:GrdX protein [Clostridiaceae bacterium JG1575]|nr:GrdX protein [Clostridiaceae bacterium JG1575]